MRRGQAGRLVRDSKLVPHERLIMLALLDRADNEDCAIPAWRSPSLRAVEHDTGLSHATVLARLAHLELHGWIKRDGAKPGQVKGSKENGRGKSGTRWLLVPGNPDACWCPKPDRSARDPSGRKKGQPVTHLDRSDAPVIPAGQTASSTKGCRDEGSRGEGLPEPWSPEDIADWLEQTGGER